MRAMTERARLLRGASTPSEQSLWEALRDRRLSGTKWRRQQKMGRFVLDFFCAEHRLGVEIDGSAHRGRQDLDEERQRLIERSGVRVVRFTVTDIETNLPGVLCRLSEMLAAPSPLVGEGANGRTV
jgi:very-short-patch-repair endonuclease